MEKIYLIYLLLFAAFGADAYLLSRMSAEKIMGRFKLSNPGQVDQCRKLAVSGTLSISALSLGTTLLALAAKDFILQILISIAALLPMLILALVARNKIEKLRVQ